MADRDEVRWGLARRFEFLEWRIYWTGRINRKDIEDMFGVSTPQASADLKVYQDIASENIYYDSTEKAYRATESFSPKFLLLSADRYLLQLNAILSGGVEPADTWFSSLPPASTTPTILRRVEPATLQTVLRAIERRQELDIVYQSLTNTRVRTIAPHSIASDGHRWHARAWCKDREAFRDFVLTRVQDIRAERASDSNPSDDTEWNTLFDLKLIPHPDLDPAQRSAVEKDFGMDGGQRLVKIRVALAFYLVKRLNLDLSDEAIEAKRKQLQLVNLDELERARDNAVSDARRRVLARRQE